MVVIFIRHIKTASMFDHLFQLIQRGKEEMYLFLETEFKLVDLSGDDKVMPRSLRVPKTGLGRRLVMTDIHGCARTFAALLERLSLRPEDQLFLLGDYINKGPDSKGVLDQILHLRERGFQVYCLRGNHEQQLLAALKEHDFALPSQYKHLQPLLGRKGKVRKRYRRLLTSLLYYIELDDCFLVHAGFNFHAEHPMKAWGDMLNLRHIDAGRLSLLQGKTLIHGHTPALLSDIEQAVRLRAQVINLDNGMAMRSKHVLYGNMLCLDLDTYQIHLQENQDM